MFTRPTLSLILVVLAGAGQAETLASTDQITVAIAGNTVQGSMSVSGAYTEFYAADGTIKGDGCTGKWTAEGVGMCSSTARPGIAGACVWTEPRSPG